MISVLYCVVIHGKVFYPLMTLSIRSQPAGAAYGTAERIVHGGAAAEMELCHRGGRSPPTLELMKFSTVFGFRVRQDRSVEKNE